MEAARRHLIQASGLYVVQGSYYCDEGEKSHVRPERAEYRISQRCC